jgi:DNA-binding Lrp family transcriptional regulator
VDEKQRRVLDEVRRCRGRSQAMTARQLARMTGIREREVRSIIADLRRQGHAIGSAVNPPYGYFMPATFEEARECQAHLYSRMREIGITARAFEQAYGQDRQGRQMVLDLFDEAQYHSPARVCEAAKPNGDQPKP